MNRMTRTGLVCAVALLSTSAVMGFSRGAPANASGVPTDMAGRTCAACHRPDAANSDPRGRLTVLLDRAVYRPGVKQTLRVRLEHPEARRWGFQMTARPTSDTTQMAGSFTPNANIVVNCDPSGSAPCGGSREFATHSTASSRQGTTGGVEWEVEWTPPANEVGEITLYLAGNAADGTAGNTNDRIYTTTVKLAAEGACNLTQRPTLRSLANGASFAGTLAPNGLASVFGMNFEVAGRTRQVGTGDLVNGAFPQQLACVAVEIAGRRAPVTYVQADQINFQVPTVAQTGPVPVVIILNPGRPNELRSDQGTVTLAEYSPGWFTFGGRSIAATTADGRIVADPAVVPGGVAARRGDVVTLYGTGFGFTEPVFQAGEIPERAARLRDPITITVGGTVLAASDILYAGLAPGLISGLYQFNIRIPMGVSPGLTPVVATMGGVSTQTAGGGIPVQ
ncbi:MAG: hypothetical protein NTX13_06185 [Acidobacteria bacterium]|nr:hypothetical protein [Acidobacteriota bacterium]